jgi:hypothetical protein
VNNTPLELLGVVDALNALTAEIRALRQQLPITQDAEDDQPLLIDTLPETMLARTIVDSLNVELHPEQDACGDLGVSYTIAVDVPAFLASLGKLVVQRAPTNAETD